MAATAASQINPASTVPGLHLVDGSDIAALVKITTSAKAGIVAFAGGGQTGATQLTSTYNEVDTCVNDNDSMMLPSALPGTAVFVANVTGHTLAVYGQPSNPANASAGDTIASHASNTQQPTATGVTQATTVPGWYICTTLGQWKQSLG